MEANLVAAAKKQELRGYRGNLKHSNVIKTGLLEGRQSSSLALKVMQFVSQRCVNTYVA